MPNPGNINRREQKSKYSKMGLQIPCGSCFVKGIERLELRTFFGFDCTIIIKFVVSVGFFSASLYLPA